MRNYTYSLQKYSGRNSRHTCPSCGRPHCFTFYVDGNNQPIAEDVGRCEHLNSCGYEKTPKMFFDEHPQERKEYRPALPQQKKEEKTDYIPFRLIQQSEGTDNSLMRYLRRFFPEKEIRQATADYHLGCTKRREAIFPQIDRTGMCRTAKIIDYDNEGHRIKPEWGDRVDWVHSRYMKMQGKKSSDFGLKQCLFGEHLLPKRPDDVVCLTEGEKTAVICSMVFPQFVWVSCGGQGLFKQELCKPLAGRDVIVYADANAVNEWEAKAGDVLAGCRSYTFSDWHRNEPQGSKRDIADLILEDKARMQVKPTTIGDVMGWMAELGIPKGRITFNV